MTTLVDIPVHLIESSPKNPRKTFDDASIESLAASIDRLGVLQPILVRKRDNAERYEIIAGERRWRASQRANKPTIPALVLEPDETIAAEIRLLENLERDQLNLIEEAKAFQAMLDLFQCTDNDLARRLKRSLPYVRNRIDLLALDQRVQQMVTEKQIPLASAVEIARNLQTPDDQYEIAKQVIEHELSAAATAQRIKEHNFALRLKKQNETKKLKMQQKVDTFSSQGIITWQHFDPIKHRRMWELLFQECPTCERKGQFLRQDGVLEILCVDPECFTDLSVRYHALREQETQRSKQERYAAFNQILESDTLTIEHLQYLLWSLIHLTDPDGTRWRDIAPSDTSPTDIWNTITTLSEEQVLTQIVRLTVFYLAAQNNNNLPTELRRSLVKRFGLPSQVLFDRSQL